MSEHSWEHLVEHAITHEGCVVSQAGGVVARTGERTGRSVSDRYIVKNDLTADQVNWNPYNQPFAADKMGDVWQEVAQYCTDKQLFKGQYKVGADQDYALHIKAQTEYAWHQLFIRNLFMTDDGKGPGVKLGKKGEWSLLSLPGLELDADRYGLNSSAALFIDFHAKKVLLCGLRYAGEMKKAFFSVLNFLLPAHGVLPMHCAANEGKNGDVSLFFGLSGTGKTSLSSDVNRQLIGDDEHGWSEQAVFNFEGGCYAKCIGLDESKEPLIWRATNREGSVLENVVLNKQGKPDFNDCSLTKNTRSAYSRSVLENCVASNRGATPERVIFLTCDLYGVLPPVSCLTMDQSRFWFLNGYTAKIGNTLYSKQEVSESVVAIQPTFSACFGQAFFPLKPQVYADLLRQRLKQTSAKVYLVNTGWHSGAHQAGGERFDIALTRRIIDHIHDGSVEIADKVTLPGFDLSIPVALEGVPGHLLNPQLAWQNREEYQKNLAHLQKLCYENYEQYQEVTA